MATDLFEQLSTTSVPPVPEDFNRTLHDRVNHNLLALHLFDFVVKAMPFALVHAMEAVVFWFVLTLAPHHKPPTDPTQH
jgi:hypothetical protein